MWCTEEMRRWGTRPFDCALPERDVASHVMRRAEMQLAMKIPVIAELMSFANSTMYEVGPTLRMAAQNKKRGAHTVLAECVENPWRRIRIGTIVERQRNFSFVRWKMSEHGTENEAISVKRSVYRAA